MKNGAAVSEAIAQEERIAPTDRWRTQADDTTYRGLAALCAGVITTAALALAVVATHFADETTSSPLRPDGVWSGVWVGAILVAFAAYGIGLLLLAQARVPSRPVVAIAITIQLVPLFAPLLLSRDAYAYWAYGRMAAVHDLNPFVDPPDAAPADPAVAKMGADWIDSPSVYGPAFVASAEGVARLAGKSETTALAVLRGAAAAAIVALTLLASRLGRNAGFSAGFIGWSPLLALHFAGGGHNTAFMMTLVLAALVLAARDRFVAAGGVWALAAAIQWLPLMFFGLWLVALRGRRLVEAGIGFTATAAVAAAVSTLRYGTGWLGAFWSARDDAFWTSSLSLPFQLQRVGVPERSAVAALSVAFLIVYTVLALHAWRVRRPPLAKAAVAVSLSTAWLVPWYAVWSTSLAAVEEDRLARVLAFSLTAYVLLDALPR